jgi:SpoVK/Ycf46/Vps4 family AAA+-type ATPase
LILDVGARLGSLVGQSEANVRQALRLVDAMAQCVAMIDEVEKALAGVASSGQTDSGVSARMFAGFLTWLNDHESDAVVVCTANDVAKLPPEFGRSERFDGTFFLDLPGPAEKGVIWEMYLRTYGLDPGHRRPRDTDFTGAEVKSCCRLAALLAVPLVEAAQNIVPVAVTAGEAVERFGSGRVAAAWPPTVPGSTRGAVTSPPGPGGTSAATRPATDRSSENPSPGPVTGDPCSWRF